LKNTPKFIHDNKEIVRQIIGKNWREYENISKRLKNDEEIFELAFRQNKNIQASEDLRQYFIISLAYRRTRSEIYKYSHFLVNLK
jgi:hypothetical protein